MSRLTGATVLLGPKTRLGRAVVDDRRGSPLLAVARDPADVGAVAAATGLAAADIVDASAGELADRVRALGDGPVRLVVAALGPVHPLEPDFDADLATVRRDLGYVDEVLACGRPVEVVLVSTVIALAPGDDRRYYGGWKCLLEELLQQRVTRTGGRLAVLYPGRLRPGRGGPPWHRLHASYERLARIALDPGLRPAGRTVGADARIWLAVRSISFAFRSLSLSSGRDRGALGGARDSGSTGRARE
ncbi:hypothetical protein KVF89_26835 [Nocardioides carbamazepini]|uniref:hypothetical protein n=1 Tax=Nocardioides carbamazepini TaxID=2854259 RepID=UPI00214A86E3|nr:hypothetical protein [Nocardioides carbamazepini]MCR1786176.1 hypothetical protein [Nocardioides carbamazepini]